VAGAEAPLTGQNRYLWPLLVIVLLHFVGIFIPGRAAWGFNYWSLLGQPLSFGLLALAVVLILPPVSLPVSAFLGRTAARLTDALRRLGPILLVALVSVGMLVILMVFRSRAHVYGDGFAVLGTVSDENLPPMVAQNYLQLLSVFFHRAGILVGDRLFGATPGMSFAFLSCLGGVLGLWAVHMIARCLVADNPRRWLLTFAALSSGSVILFFGYIENYTWATSVGLWSLYFSIRYVQSTERLGWALALAVLASAFHMIAFPYLVVTAAVWVTKKYPGGALTSFFSSSTRSTMLIVAGSAITVTLFELVTSLGVFVPLWPQPDNPYWFLSKAHLLDTANLAILVAPVGLAAGIYRLLARRSAGPKGSAEEKVPAMAALLFFLAAFWINPDLGAVRDWDLLSLYGIPFSLLGGLWLLRLASGGAAQRALVFSAFVVAAVQVGPNLVEKNRLDVAVGRLDGFLWQDPHYGEEYEKAARCQSWGFVLLRNLEEFDRAKKYILRRLDAKKDSDQSWAHMGDIYYHQAVYDSASICYVNALKYAPGHSSWLNKLANAELQCGRLPNVLKYISLAEKENPGDASIQTTFGVLLYQSGRKEEALARFRRAWSLKPHAQEQAFNLGLYF
jgi:tetratricopeptide (TPR) repeat protein